MCTDVQILCWVFIQILKSARVKKKLPMLLKGVLFMACAQPTGALLLTLSRISDS